MTREEALSHLFIQCGIYVYHQDGTDLVNQIYDEFESRTCKNCKHSGLYTMGWMPCLHPENEYHIKEVHDEFGCNKWEKKND